MHSIFPALLDGETMNIRFCNILIERNEWSLAARGTFHEGMHLVTGDVGCGKSTLALILSGLLSPSNGSVEREGIASQMVMFQSPEYHITGSTLEEECKSWGADPGKVLAFAGLAGKNDVDPLRLSRGELKQLILACILSRPYDLLILDEPFSSLDCREKERLCRTLSLRSAGITILFTHEQAFFPEVDRLWEICSGTLWDRGSIPQALLSWQHAPRIIKTLIEKGKIPANISHDDLLEAVCRT